MIQSPHQVKSYAFVKCKLDLCFGNISCTRISFLFHPSSNGEFARWGYVVMNAGGMRMGEDSESGVRCPG